MNTLLNFRPAASLLGRTAFLKLNAPALRVSAPVRSFVAPRIFAMGDNKATGTVKWYCSCCHSVFVFKLY